MVTNNLLSTVILAILLYGSVVVSSGYRPCKYDTDCASEEFCKRAPGAAYCEACVDCQNLYHRLDGMKRCATNGFECGDCLKGYFEEQLSTGSASTHSERCRPDSSIYNPGDVGDKDPELLGMDNDRDTLIYQIILGVLFGVIVVACIGGVVYYFYNRKQSSVFQNTSKPEVNPPAYDNISQHEERQMESNPYYSYNQRPSAPDLEVGEEGITVNAVIQHEVTQTAVPFNRPVYERNQETCEKCKQNRDDHADRDHEGEHPVEVQEAVEAEADPLLPQKNPDSGYITTIPTTPDVEANVKSRMKNVQRTLSEASDKLANETASL